MIRRPGFTIVELLVVIAIVGILMAVLLPAVQSARAAARRVQCSSNLRQIGIAIATYHEALAGYPLTMTSGGGPDNRGGCRTGHFSWLAQILPFIDQQALHNHVDFKITMADACEEPLDGRISAGHPNAMAAATLVSVFLCPSDGYTGEDSEVMGSAHPAPDNYAANAGWPSYATGFHGERPYPGAYNGFISIAKMGTGKQVLWHPDGPIRQIDVRDGLSNTAAVAERLIMRGESLQAIRGAEDRFQSFHLPESPRTLPQIIQTSTLNPHSNPVYSAYQGRSWISGWVLTAPTYMHVFTPNTFNMHLHGGETTGDNLITPSSYHGDGVNVLMGDGRVIFVIDSIEPKVWWAVGSRNDRRQVDLPR